MSIRIAAIVTQVKTGIYIALFLCSLNCFLNCSYKEEGNFVFLGGICPDRVLFKQVS